MFKKGGIIYEGFKRGTDFNSLLMLLRALFIKKLGK